MLELYDLQSDPYEQHDLSGSRQHADQFSELKTWVVEVATQMVGSEILYYTRDYFLAYREYKYLQYF